ncbi:MAG TPA: enoyl-CoA hydratase-related protein [Acidimicrobiales bacterium]|nr:enoyl-CoA hydratase-related protein [Acidimicrobiales bacterium]
MPSVEFTTAGPVATITLSDDARRNVLTVEMIDAVIASIDACEADDAVRVVVVTNTGRTFCAGADLSGPGGAPVDLAGLLDRVQRSPLPFVGRVAGHCVAGGVGLAAVMDLSIAVEDATFGFTEVRLGLAPAIISVVCLPKMRRGDALAAFLRGGRFPATEAARLGLVTATAGAASLDAAVGEVVADLLLGEPAALAAAKRLVYEVPTMSVGEAFAHASGLSASLFASEAAREGIAAYLEKRPARWAPPAP